MLACEQANIAAKNKVIQQEGVCQVSEHELISVSF